MIQRELADRAILEARIRESIAALEARDGAALAAGLHPEASFAWLNQRWQGRDQIQAALTALLAGWTEVRLKPVHLLIDPGQHAAALAWVCRYRQAGAGSCQQLLGGTVLEFTPEGLLRHGRTYLDPVRSGSIPDFSVPWPAPGWNPCQEPGPPPDRAVLEGVVQANARAWASHEVAQIGQLIHDDICVSPPWDYLRGRSQVERGAQVFFEHYRETQVTPHRVIVDPTQPYFGVCEQTFTCTNPETGRRGSDSDYAFFEVAEGKLRYWRTYFDTSQSVQVLEKTDGFLQKQSPYNSL